MSKLIGKTADFTIPLRKQITPIVIEVTIADAREVFGRVDFLVKYGDGEAWVSEDSITLK